MTGTVYKAVIFDLDGTLLDTLADLADSMNAVLEGLGYPTHPVDSYRVFVGDGIVNLARRALPQGRQDHALVERCVVAMGAEYERRWASRTAPYPGIPELLRDLASRRVSMAVLSNKPHEFTERMVAHFFGGGVFETVLGAREGVPRKPDPTAVREILRALALRESEAGGGRPALGRGPRREPPSMAATPSGAYQAATPGRRPAPSGAYQAATLYVGDSSTDMDTALAAGLVSVGVLWGFRTKEELLEHGAHHLIERPGELLRFFGEGR